MAEGASPNRLAARVVQREGEWCVLSEDGSHSFGCYDTEARARERLLQVEHFKEQAASAGAARLTVEQVRSLCPRCAEEMEARGWREIRAGALLEAALLRASDDLAAQLGGLSPESLAGLCEKWGPDEGFRTRCMDSISRAAPDITDPGAFCNAIEQACFETGALSQRAPVGSEAALSGALRASARLVGGPLDAEGFRWPIVVVEAGPTRIRSSVDESLTVFLPPETVQLAIADGAFEGDSYEDHPTESEARERPERSVRSKIGRVSEVRWDPTVGEMGAAVGVWTVVDETHRQRLLNAVRNGIGDFYEFSIYGPVASRIEEVAGQRYEVVSRIGKVSTDLVTQGGAGGRFLSRLAASLRAGGGQMRWEKFLERKPALAAALLAAESDDAAIALVDALDLDLRGVDRDLFLAELRLARQEMKEEEGPKGEAEKEEAEKEEAGPKEKEEEGPKEEPFPELARKAAEISRQLAEAEKVAAAFRAQIHEQEVERKVAGLPPATQEHLRPLLRAAGDGAAMDAILARERAYLRRLHDVEFPRGTLRGALGIEVGADEWERFFAGLDGFFERRDMPLPTGERVPMLPTLAAAIQAFPGHGGRYVRINALNIGHYLRGTYIGGAVASDRESLVPWGANASLACACRDLTPRRRRPSPPSLTREMFLPCGFVVRRGGEQPRILRASITSSSLGEIFADRAHKAFMRSYHSASDWEQLLELASATSMLSDFKVHRRIRRGEYLNPGVVAEGATYPTATSPTDVEELAQLQKRGYIEDVTLEALLDPDGQKLAFVPGDMGKAAGREVREDILDVITVDNPTMNADGVTLYAAGHNNTGTLSLTLANLAATRQAMRKQVAQDSAKRLGSVNDPAYLLVPIDLVELAERIANPSEQYVLSPTADTDASVDPLAFKGRIKGIVELTHQTDTNNWVAMASSGPGGMPTFELSRFEGVPQPEFFQQFDPDSPAMFDADKGKWKVRFWWDVTPLDWRGFYRQVVA
jgi:hypothetical protein